MRGPDEFGGDPTKPKKRASVVQPQQRPKAIIRPSWTSPPRPHRISLPTRVLERPVADERVQRRLVAILAADVVGCSRGRVLRLRLITNN